MPDILDWPQKNIKICFPKKNLSKSDFPAIFWKIKNVAKMTIFWNFFLRYSRMKVLNLQTNVENMSGILKTIPKKILSRFRAKKVQTKKLLIVAYIEKSHKSKTYIFLYKC